MSIAVCILNTNRLKTYLFDLQVITELACFTIIQKVSENDACSGNW